MVKRQKEKQYLAATENKRNAKLRSGTAQAGSVVQRKLPFNCCALTLTPFTNPVCNQSGVVFENSALMEFLIHNNNKDPVTGKSLQSRAIIQLHMDKDEEGRWQCPVLTKPFSDHTKIVAILTKSKKEAYVYSFEAYNELNVKAKNWLDLTTGNPFSPKKDVLILNDPAVENKERDISKFWHIINSRSANRQHANVNHSVTATRIMEKLKEEKKRAAPEKQSKKDAPAAKKLRIFSDDVTGVQLTSGKASGSFTSTSMNVESENRIREASKEEILLDQFKLMKAQKQKGYVRMITNLGDLLLELRCDIAPRTCTNFLGLCQAKKYDNTSFHRSIKNFMVQGGRSKDGDDSSLWGPAFVDEFDDRLKHDGIGVLSSANAGPNTNKRQFFITFKSAPHLDRKHSVFGNIVDGMKVLKKMEDIPTDSKDRPTKPITILKTEILVDPANDAEKMQEKRIEDQAKARQQEKQRQKAIAKGKTTKTTKNESTGSAIGKYLPKNSYRQAAGDAGGLDAIPTLSATKRKSKPPAKTGFGDFSGW